LSFKEYKEIWVDNRAGRTQDSGCTWEWDYGGDGEVRESRGYNVDMQRGQRKQGVQTVTCREVRESRGYTGDMQRGQRKQGVQW
jgi:hypothetical protein